MLRKIGPSTPWFTTQVVRRKSRIPAKRGSREASESAHVRSPVRSTSRSKSQLWIGASPTTTRDGLARSAASPGL